MCCINWLTRVTSNLGLDEAVLFGGFKGSGVLGTIITGLPTGLHFYMCILHFSITMFPCWWIFDILVELGMICMLWVGMWLEYTFEKIDSSYFCWWLWYSAIRIFFKYWNELIFSFLWYLCIYTSIDSFKLFCSGWKLDSGGIFRSSAGLFTVLEFSSVHEMLLTSIFLLSIRYITVFLQMWTISNSMLSRGMFSNFGYLWWILWATARRIRPDSRSSLAFSW